VEGRVQQLVRIEDLPDGAVTGLVRPDWFIFSQLAQRLGSSEFAYPNAKAVLQEISAAVPGFPAQPDRKPRKLTPKAELPLETWPSNGLGTGPLLLVAEPGGFGHCGVDLSSKVEGLGELALEEGFRLHPEDLASLGLAAGERLTVALDAISVTGPVRADADCPRGVVYYYRPVALGGLDHRADFEALYHGGSNPVRVEVRKAESVGKKRECGVASARAAAAP
jgi:anaerobic selenocysteine-containing dehydrogenase